MDPELMKEMSYLSEIQFGAVTDLGVITQRNKRNNC